MNYIHYCISAVLAKLSTKWTWCGMVWYGMGWSL